MGTEQGTLDLYDVPVGRSGVETMMKLAAAHGGKEKEETLFVTSSRELVQRARDRNLNAVNFEYLVNEILRRCAPAGVKRVQISRKTQELLLERLLDKTFQVQLDPETEASRQQENLRELSQKKSFRKAMVALVGQLGRACVSPEEFQDITKDWLRNNDVPDKQRLAYISKTVYSIYSAYGKYLAELASKGEKSYDLETLYTEALHCLEEKQNQGKLPWRRVYIAGFHSFDPLVRHIILALAEHCSVSVALPWEAEEEEYRRTVYNVSRDSHIDLSSAKRREETVPAAPPERRHPALTWLLEHFRRPVQKPAQAEDHVQIWKAADAREELCLVLRDVKQSILNGMAPDRIAIVVRKLSEYSGLRRGCDAYGIPARFPETASFSSSPVLEYALSFLTSLQGHGRDQVNQVAAFLTLPLQELLWGLRIDMVKNAMSKQFYTDAVKLWDDLSLPPVLGTVKELWQDAVTTPYQSIESYCSLIERLFSGVGPDVEFKGIGENPWLQKAGLLYRQGALTLPAFKNLTGGRQQIEVLLDHIRNDYGGIGAMEEKMLPEEFAALLTETAADLQVELQRGKSAGVRILEASNMEEADFDKVYLLGMFEGKFPYARQESWVYNDQERQDLKAMGLDLPGTAESYDEDLHFFLSVCAAPRETLIFTYYEDEKQTLSPYLTEVQELFSDLQEKSPDPAGAVDALNEDEWNLAQAEQTRPKPGRVPERGILETEEARQVVREKLGNSFSASRLETYTQCPFRFLAQYIWDMKTDNPVGEEADGGTIGVLIHSVLQDFVNQYLGLTNENLLHKEGVDRQTMSTSLQSLFRKACEKAERGGKVVPGPFWDAQQQRWSRCLDNWLRVELKQRGLMQESSESVNSYFTPVATEVPFEVKLPLNNQEIGLQGRIDRVDVVVNNATGSVGPYLYLTDYKTGKVPGGPDFLNRNLQMPVYLYATEQLLDSDDELGKRIEFAGASGKASVAGGGYYSVGKECKRTINFIYAKDEGGIDNTAIKNALPLRPLKSAGCPWNLQQEKKTAPVDDAKALTKLLQESVGNVLSAIKDGDFRPTPENSCSKYCPAADFCRFNAFTKEE
ncbi:MAG: PD-(D/E)XK nuclease family protein [Succiniclasticum sp.]|jgi:ATP-dependent helicase/DNAse subunit B